jgi:hypothetical protein
MSFTIASRTVIKGVMVVPLVTEGAAANPYRGTTVLGAREATV